MTRTLDRGTRDPVQRAAALRERVQRYVFLTGLCYEEHEAACPTDGTTYLSHEYYPAASLAQIRGFWRRSLELMRRGKVPDRLGLYVHWPFCVSHCTYCFCNVRVPRGGGEMADYAAMLLREADAFRPVFAGKAFTSGHIGGGTPSFIPEEALDRLLGGLRERFEWAPGAGWSIEVSPATLTRRKVEVLRRHGIGTVVVGVQTMDPAVLATVQRGAQPPEMVERAVGWLQEAGMVVRLDLLFGLEGQSEASFLRDFVRGARMRPHDFLVHFFDARPHTLFSRVGKKTPRDHWQRAMRLSRRLDETAASLGYPAAPTDPADPEFLCPIIPLGKDSVGLGASVLGLGSGAQSHAVGAAWYEHLPADRGVLVRRGTLPFRAWVMDLEGEMRSFAIRILSHLGTLPRAAFRSVFDCDVLDVPGLAADFRDLETLGRLQITGDTVRFHSPDKLNLLVYTKHLHPPGLVDAMIERHRGEFERFLEAEGREPGGWRRWTEHKYPGVVWKLYYSPSLPRGRKRPA